MVTLIIDSYRVAARARATWYRNQLHPSDVMCGIRRSVHSVRMPGHMHAHIGWMNANQLLQCKRSVPFGTQRASNLVKLAVVSSHPAATTLQQFVQYKISVSKDSTSLTVAQFERCELYW